jgi:hypothetical protein
MLECLECDDSVQIEPALLAIRIRTLQFESFDLTANSRDVQGAAGPPSACEIAELYSENGESSRNRGRASYLPRIVGKEPSYRY